LEEIGKGISERRSDETKKRILKQVKEVKARGCGVIKGKLND
jgi:hypothetical protein